MFQRYTVDFVVDVDAFDVCSVIFHDDVDELVDGCCRGYEHMSVSATDGFAYHSHPAQALHSSAYDSREECCIASSHPDILAEQRT